MERGKYYIAQCLNVDVSSFGKTKAEAAKTSKKLLICILKTRTSPKSEKLIVRL